MERKITIYLCLIVFIIVFLVDYFLINKRKLKTLNGKNNKKKKVKPIGELEMMIVRNKLDKSKLNIDKIIIVISLINSIIISSVSGVIMLLPLKMMWKMIIAFVLLFALIYSLYEIYGKYLKRKEDKK